jgi:hypothetical protein
MVSFFAKEEKISAAELREILAMIENQESANNFVYLKSLPKQPDMEPIASIYLNLAACCFLLHHFFTAQRNIFYGQ